MAEKARQKRKIKLKGRIAGYFTLPIKLGFFLLAVNIVLYFMHIPSALVLTAFTVVYFAVVLITYYNNRPLLINEFVSFATEYGQVQRHLLSELRNPYAVLDAEGRLVWTNGAFETLTGKEHGSHRSITSIFSSLTRDQLPAGDEPRELSLEKDGSFYTAELRRISLDDMAKNSDVVDAEGFSGCLYALTLYDRTAERIALQEVDDQSLVVGFIYIDDYDEALSSVEDVRRSLLAALIDRQVNKYISSVDGLCSKIEKDKYLAILRKKSLLKLQESRFELLQDVKGVSIGNDMAITVSLGLGYGGLSFAQNYKFARNAIDLALGRGGDQAVVRTPENTYYFGGKTQQVEKSTRVKARVKAQALKEILQSREQVFIMGHRIGDVDSFGSAIGIYRVAATLDKEAHIVLNEITGSLQAVVDLFRDNQEYPADLFLTSAEAMERAGDNAALVVVDVNKPSITECPELLHMCKSIIVLDHHRQGTEVIENATLSYIEAYASSACEMVSEVLQYIDENVRIRPEEADAMYAGIVVDTNNFIGRTGVRTFEAAAFLRRCGADVTRVRKLFREDAAEYKARADAVSQAEIYRGAYAISICPSEGLMSPTVVGAQAANELLNIKGVRASFILTEYQNQIFISARSMDEVNVQVIMEHLGGGGHMNTAGCQMEDVTPAEAIGVLKKTIDNMIQEGELQ